MLKKIEIRAAFGWIREATAAIRVFLVPICISTFASVILALPDQTLEYYYAVFENLYFQRQMEFWREVIIAFIAVIFLGVAIAYSARVLEVADRERFPERRRVWNISYRWAPAVIGVAPLVAACCGLWLTGKLIKNINPDELLNRVHEVDPDYVETLSSIIEWSEASRWYFGAAATFLFISSIVLLFVFGLLYGRSRSGVAFYEFSKQPVAAFVSIGLAIAVVSLFRIFALPVPQFIGAIAVFSLFASCLALLLTQISIWSRLSGIPIIAILICSALLFSILDLNNNHELRRVDQAGAQVLMDEESVPIEPRLPDLENQFLTWYNRRGDAKAPRYTDRKYPVYIVAAQGGGMYAAAQTLLFLVKMQTNCELFAQHLFAISGVSGGSVGAAWFSAFAERFENSNSECPVYDSLPKATDDEWQMYVDARKVLLQDYLSPLLASGLFPDFVQKFLPFPIPEWSRARALEQAIEVGWERVRPPQRQGIGHETNPLRLGIVSSWTPEAARPALLLNTTEAGSGRRRLLAPFSIAAGPSNSDLRLLPVTPDYDVALSTAAVASARFPWLTPAAWFWGIRGDSSRRRFSIVDGGYFENSGVATATDLIERLEEISRRHDLPVQFHLVVMTSGEFPDSSFDGLQELLAPIRSLLATRRARTYTTIDLADRQLGPIDPMAPLGTAPSRVRRLQKVEISDFLTPLPLGWRLSLASIVQVDRRTGLPKHCIPNDRFEQSLWSPAFGSGDCVALLIYHHLRGDDLDSALQAARARLPERVQTELNASGKLR